jgi:hypothetical protein
MVPSAYVIMSRLPLLSNEKVDRKKLLPPTMNDFPSRLSAAITAIDAPRVAPANKLDEAIVNVFATTLGTTTPPPLLACHTLLIYLLIY